MSDGRAASVRQRLLNQARARGEEFQRVLTRYALERLLYRISQSEYRDQFVMKGAMLFVLWTGRLARPTKDLDLLGYGDPSQDRLLSVFRALCAADSPEDGLTFLPDTVRTTEIREDDVYGGIRVTLTAMLGTARLPLQVDVGFGDVITPGPVEADFPVLLEMAAPRLYTYPPETVVAEKCDAMITLGMDNSRMKDFFDLRTLAMQFQFDGQLLASAMAATFSRRQTSVPAETPVALTGAFSSDASKQAQWRAFIRRSVAGEHDLSLAGVIELLQGFLLPPLQAVRTGSPFSKTWPAGGPWL